jgi:RNA polymerase sigma-70 factor (ECF subfamily)
MLEDEKLSELVRSAQENLDSSPDEAFAPLDEFARPLAQRFFLGKGFSPDETADLTQVAMLRVFKGIGTFRGDSPFRPWLFEILTNVFRNELRRRHSMKREGVELSLDGVPPSDQPGGTGPLFLQLVTDQIDPLTNLLRTEGEAHFQAALQELPKQMRRVCQLRYAQERKYKEIAALLGISIETVKAHLHQAKNRLEERLARDSALRRAGG